MTSFKINHLDFFSESPITITSDAERSFVAGLNENNITFWLGGSDTSQEGRFVWITGESGAYGYWGTNDQNKDDYDFAYSHSGDRWYYGTATGSANYICEWSANTYVGVSSIPDLNGNRVPEIATLYIDYTNGKHIVKIRDPKTDKVINTLTFKSGFGVPPAGSVVLKDMNRNGVPEVGVLYTEFGQPSVGIKDAKNDKVYLNTLRFLDTAYNPKEISVYPDTNGNGYSEITVLGVKRTNNAPKAEMRDSKTGKLLSDTLF